MVRTLAEWREIGSVHHEVIKFVSYLWSKGVFEAINYGVWSWLTCNVKCQLFLLFPPNLSWKYVLSQRRISKAYYVNVVKYHNWSLLYTVLFLTHIWCPESSLCFDSGFSSGITVGYVRQCFGSDHTPWLCTFHGLNHAEIFWMWAFILDLGNSSFKKYISVHKVQLTCCLRSFQPRLVTSCPTEFGGNWHLHDVFHPLSKAVRCGWKFLNCFFVLSGIVAFPTYCHCRNNLFCF